MAEARAPSQPIPGGVRIGVDAAIAAILVWFANQYVPLEVMPQVQALIVAGVTGIVGGIGKVLRDGGNILGKFF